MISKLEILFLWILMLLLSLNSARTDDHPQPLRVSMKNTIVFPLLQEFEFSNDRNVGRSGDFFGILDYALSIAGLNCSIVDLTDVVAIVNEVKDYERYHAVNVKELDFQCEGVVQWRLGSRLMGWRLGNDNSNAETAATRATSTDGNTIQLAYYADSIKLVYLADSKTVSQCRSGLELTDVDLDTGFFGSLLVELIMLLGKQQINDVVDDVACTGLTRFVRIGGGAITTLYDFFG